MLKCTVLVYEPYDLKALELSILEQFIPIHHYM